MALLENDFLGYQRKRPGVSRMKKHNLRTDMTPMVDLGFLLIAFFVITAQLTEPNVTNLTMPQDGPPIKSGTDNALTVMLGGQDKVYYYHGEWDQAYAEGNVYKTSMAAKGGLRDVIRQKQQYLDYANIGDEGRSGLMLTIKPNPEASYESVINVLDEMLINEVKKYALVQLNPQEEAYLEYASTIGISF